MVNTMCFNVLGLPGAAGGQHSSVASLATSTYYQSSEQQHSPAKYPENGHDTLSDFVTFVCSQEAENTQQGGQVPHAYNIMNLPFLLKLVYRCLEIHCFRFSSTVKLGLQKHQYLFNCSGTHLHLML